MPKRPSAHQIGDSAAAAVAALVARCGHAVERITNDYGEDLLVQTSHNGVMDSGRIWIQVKGTASVDRLRGSDGSPRLSFSMLHIVRWIRSSDPVVIVLWDVTGGRGWFARPEQVDKLRTLVQKSATIRFRDDTPFDEANFSRLVWGARIDHYQTMCTLASAHDAVGLDDADPDSKERKSTDSAYARILAIDFLRLIGLVEHDGEAFYVSPATKQRYFALWEVRIRQEFGAPEDAPHDEDKWQQMALGAAMLLVLQQAKSTCDLLLPTLLLTTCAEVAALFCGGLSAVQETFERLRELPDMGAINVVVAQPGDDIALRAMVASVLAESPDGFDTPTDVRRRDGAEVVEQLSRWLHDPASTTWVAVAADGQGVGLMTSMAGDKVVEIVQVWIDARWRAFGLLGQLLDELLTSSLGASIEIVLSADDDQARSTYERLGFVSLTKDDVGRASTVRFRRAFSPAQIRV